MNIGAWLKNIGLPQYIEAFREQEIGPEILGDLDHAALKELGVDILGHRMMILRAIRDTARSETPAKSGTPSEWEAERRQLTILFCDMVGSTNISSRLDPEEFRDLIRLYHETVSDAAARAGGHVAQFLGDGSMIYFGYPHAQEDATERAVNMGLALIDALARLEPFPGGRLQTRIGIATGLVVVGDLVGRGLYEGAVVSGDAPNLAARLQAVAEPDNIVIGQRTHQLLGRSFDCQELEPMELKGIPGLTRAWRVIGPAESSNRFEAHRQQQMTPLVGRDTEMQQLLQGWAEARNGQGRAIMLRGEAGLGKSRLLRELRQQLESPKSAVIQLQCSPYFTNTALHPVTKGLELAAGYRREDLPETRLDKVLKLFGLNRNDPGEEEALIAGLMGLPADLVPPLTISVQLQRARLFDTLLARVHQASEVATALVLVEDLHWADPTTLDLLSRLIETMKDRRILLVGTYRPEFEPAWAEHDFISEIDLQRLNPEEIQTLISHLAQNAWMSDEIRATLSARADGIPFFAEELTKSVVQFDHRTANAVPTSLRDTLMARLDALSGPRHIAQVASVIGREFDIDLLAAVSGKSAPALLGSLTDLADADLIFRSKQPRTWVFRHALIRDAAYESLLMRSRQDMHLRIARAIVDQFPERAAAAPEFLARHFTEAGDRASAARNWLAAGQAARLRGIVSEAHAHMVSGLEQVAKMPESGEREALELQLHVGHGAVLSGIKGHAAPEVGAAFSRAGALNPKGTSRDFQIAFHNGHGAHLAMRGEVAAGHEELSMMAEVAGDDPRLLVSAGSAMAWSNFSIGQFQTSIDWGLRSEAIRKEGGWDPTAPRHTTGDPIVITRCWHAASLWALGFADQATAKAREALDYAETLNDPYSRIYAQVNGVCRVAALQGRSEMVLQVATEAIAYAKQMGYDFAAGYSLFWQAEALAATGDMETALKIIGASIAACQAMSFRLHEPQFRSMQAVMLADHGDLKGAQAALDGMEALVESSGELWQASEVRCARAHVAEAAGDQVTARAAWKQAVVHARKLSSPAWELRATTGLARLMAREGESEEALALLEPVYERFTEGFDTGDMKRATALMGQLTQRAVAGG